MAKTSAAPKTAKASKAEANAQLAKGAKEIQQAKAGEGDGKGALAVLPPEVIITPSQRPVNEIIAEKIKVRGDGIGVDIAEDLSPEEWVPAIAYFTGLEQHIGFVIGDMIRFGQSKFGEKYAPALKATNRPWKTLVNYTSVAGSIALEARRPELTYSHHAEVANLKANHQVKLLDKAAKEGLTIRQVRDEAKKIADAGGSKDPKASTRNKKNARGTNKKKTGTTSEGDKGEGSATALTAEDQAEYDSNVEKADEIITFLKGKLFGKLPPSNKKQWHKILRPMAQAWEKLNEEVG